MVSTYFLWFPSVFNEHTYKSFIFSHFQLHCTLFREDNQQSTEINLSGSEVTAVILFDFQLNYTNAQPRAAVPLQPAVWCTGSDSARVCLLPSPSGDYAYSIPETKYYRTRLPNKQKPPGLQDTLIQWKFLLFIHLGQCFPCPQSTGKTGQSEVGAWGFLDGVTSPSAWLTPVYFQKPVHPLVVNACCSEAGSPFASYILIRFWTLSNKLDCRCPFNI